MDGLGSGIFGNMVNGTGSANMGALPPLKITTTVSGRNTGPGESGSATPDSQPMSPGSDLGRNTAVDYIKNRYEKRPDTTIKIPQIMRQPKKLDGEWDKMLDDKQRRHEESTPVLKEQDILALVMACTGVDSKSQYLSMLAEKDIPVNRQEVEKVAPPEITKNVRQMFESGNVAEFQSQQKRLLTYEMTPGSGVFENEPQAFEGVVKAGCSEEEASIERGFTKSLLSQWQTMEAKDITSKAGVSLEGQILKGTTKGMLDQWSKKGTESATPQEKISFSMRDIKACDGIVCESKPTRRSDVIREDDAINGEGEEVQSGTTRNLLNQWKTMGTEDGNYNRRSVIDITEGQQGSILENEPLRRTDVIRETDVIGNGDAIKSGLARNLLSQYKLKTSEQFTIERKPINIAEDEGSVAENTPTRNIDVINAVGTFTDEPSVQTGFTKSLVSQWKCKGSTEFTPKKGVIVIAEDDGRVSENDPIQRTDVVREEEALPEKVVQRGTTKSLLGHWSTVGNQEYCKPKNPIVIAEAEEKILENDPIVRTDVVRECDQMLETEQVKLGTTKSLLSQWKTKGTEEFKVERKQINICEAEGIVSENQPVIRDDIVKEEYVDETAQQIKPDTTKSLRAQWMSKAKEEKVLERAPIILAEDEGRVCENVPAVRDDVLRGEYQNFEADQVQRGTTKALLSQWSGKANEQYSKERTPINICEGEGHISENQPIIRDDVIRQYDAEDDIKQIRAGLAKNIKQEYINKSSAEFKNQRSSIIIAEDDGRVAENQPITRQDVVREDLNLPENAAIKRGYTNSMVSQWKDKPNQHFTPERSPIRIAEDEGKILENTPAVRDDVVREDIYVDDTKAVQRGTTKSLLQQWKTKGTEEFKVERKAINIAEDSGTISENQPAERTDFTEGYNTTEKERIERGNTKGAINRWAKKSSEEFKIERKPINVMEDAGKVAENEPITNTDVVRSGYNTEEDKIKSGLTKNLTEKWRNIGSDETSSKRQPINILEGEDKTVENQPIQRDDVVRENMYVEDQVQHGIAKQLTNQWKSKGSETFQINRAPINIAEDDGKVAENEPMKRTDIYREDEAQPSEIIQRGTTKHLMNQWKTKGSEEYKVTRSPIILAEGEGKVLESQPIRRDDVVREDDINAERIESGITKNLTKQWKSMGSEGFVINRAPINIAEDEGTVSENQPTMRTDIIREEEPAIDKVIQRGMAKNLKSTWQTKGSEEFVINRAPINIAEDEGKIAENEPQTRSEALSEQYTTAEEKIQKGLTKNLTNQWKSMGSGGFVINRSPINVAEGEGKVVENEPAVRVDVVREGDVEQDRVRIGMTKNLRSQWLSKGKEEFQINRQPINIAEDEGRIAENEPVKLTDVVRGEYVEEKVVQRGMAKNLANQWKAKGNEEFIINRPPINIAEGEDKVAENQPAIRADIFRENDEYQPEMIQRGITKNLTSQWKNKGSEQFQIERAPIILAEDAGQILENEPVCLVDVAREDGSSEDRIKSGITKSLVGQWKTKGSEEFRMERKPINIAEDEGRVVENEPVKREDTFREDDRQEERLELSRGHTKSKAQMWQNRREESVPRQAFRLEAEIDTSDAGIRENTPIQLQGVVKESDSLNEVVSQRGMIKSVSNRFKNTDQEIPRERKEQIEIDLAEGPSVVENEPRKLGDDVVRGEEYVPDMVEAGVTRNLVQHWKTQELESASPKFGPQKDQSAWISEMQQAPGSGVFENEPKVLEDVIRETDYAPERISVKQARNVRKLWSQREQEPEQDLYEDRPARELIRFTPPREKTPPQDDFKSFHTVTLSSGGSTPAPSDTMSPAIIDSQPPPWFPQAPKVSSNLVDGNQKSATQLQIMPSPAAKKGLKQQPLRPYQQRKLLQQQQQELQQQLLQQQIQDQQMLQHQLLQHQQQMYAQAYRDQQIQHLDDYEQQQQQQQWQQMPQYEQYSQPSSNGQNEYDQTNTDDIKRSSTVLILKPT